MKIKAYKRGNVRVKAHNRQFKRIMKQQMRILKHVGKMVSGGSALRMLIKREKGNLLALKKRLTGKSK